MRATPLLWTPSNQEVRVYFLLVFKSLQLSKEFVHIAFNQNGFYFRSRYHMPTLIIKAFDLANLCSFNGYLELFNGAFATKAVLAFEFNNLQVVSI